MRKARKPANKATEKDFDQAIDRLIKKHSVRKPKKRKHPAVVDVQDNVIFVNFNWRAK